MTTVKNTLPFDEATPIEEIEASLPESELQELDAIGDQRDDARWKAGDYARLWIDERGLPTQQCLVIIGRRTDWGVESVKKFLACSRFYHERPELRQKYDLLRHSIFDHARQCFDPESVLQAAFDKRLKPQTVKSNFPLLFDDLKESYSKVRKDKLDEARELVQVTIGKLRELAK